MAKAENKKTEEVKEQNLPAVQEPLKIGGIEIHQDVFQDDDEFVEEISEFLSKDFLEEMKGVEILAVLGDVITKEVDSEEKEFVEMHLVTESGYKSVWAGQHKFVSIAKQKNQGKGVAIKFTFLGKIHIKGGRTMNDFRITHKVLK